MSCACEHDHEPVRLESSTKVSRRSGRARFKTQASAIVLLLGSLSAAAMTAQAADPVPVRAALHPTFGRLALEWPGQVDVRAERTHDRLVLSFDHVLPSGLDPAMAELAAYVTIGRASDDGRTLVLDLQPGVRHQVTRIEGNIVALDLLGPDQVVEGPVALRSGHHGGFDRLVLEWPGTVSLQNQDLEAGTLVLHLDRPERIDTRALLARAPDRIAEARQLTGPFGSKLVLQLQPGTSTTVRQFGHNQVTIDLGGDSTPIPKPRPADPWLVHAMPSQLRAAAPRVPTLPVAARQGEVAALLQAQAAAIEALRQEIRDLKEARLPARALGYGAGSPAVLASIGGDDLAGTTGGQAEGQLPEGAADPAPAAGPEEEQDDPELEALNRVLVKAGGLLLPVGSFEISPSITYKHQGANGLLITDVGGARRVVSQDVRKDELDFSLTLQAGLPWDSQVDLKLPYVLKQEKVAMAGVSSEDNHGSGLGDIEVALLHQFVRESKYLPDVIGEVRWRAPTGDDSFDVSGNELAIGNGFHGISGTVNMTKAYDPVVFFGSLGYTANLESEKSGFDIDPGDQVNFSIGTILAAGPGTSLRAGVAQSFTGETEVDGRKIAGSDRVSGTFQVGAAAALPLRTLLDISAGVGITEDAPDFTLRVSLPYRL